MEINWKLLPIKMHFFFFMAAMGPVLPQLPVFGKDLGISSVVMGSITGILPFAFLLTKPLFGLLVDIYRVYRKTIFMTLIVLMSGSFAAMYFIPSRSLMVLNLTIDNLDACSSADTASELECNNTTIRVVCSSSCLKKPTLLLAKSVSHQGEYRLCTLTNITLSKNSTCEMLCNEDNEIDSGCLYKSLTFWGFIIFMSVGTIGFNVINSISDAICFDIVDQYHYGKQRVWGSIGFGLTALISGFVVDSFSDSYTTYAPAFVIMLICTSIDMLACLKLELPVIPAPGNIFRELKLVLVSNHVIAFITFTVLAGTLDSLVIYYLFWYLEDLAVATNTTNIKLLEGLIIAAETLGAEVIFFSISGKILERFGHVHCFSLCFINYALRFWLISIAPSPWWILPIEFFMQGPSYALTYTTIVAYANELAPPGASATMQGIAAGMSDGTGYAIGSVIGGLFYMYLGGRTTLQIFAGLGLICGVAHFVLHKTILRPEMFFKDLNGKAVWKERYRSDYESIH